MNRKVTGTTSTMAGGLMLAGMVSMGTTILLSILTAKLIDNEVIPENGIGYAAMGILLACSVLGAVVAWKRIRRQRLLTCLASGCVYYGLLLSLTALFFGGQYSGMGVTALVVLGGCGAVILMGMGQGEKPG